MQAVTALLDGKGHGGWTRRVGPLIPVTEMHRDIFSNVALDRGTGDRAHGSSLAGIELVKVPRVDLPVIRNGPGVTLIRLRRWLVAPVNQCVNHLPVFPQGLEHFDLATGSSVER